MDHFGVASVHLLKKDGPLSMAPPERWVDRANRGVWGQQVNWISYVGFTLCSSAVFAWGKSGYIDRINSGDNG